MCFLSVFRGKSNSVKFANVILVVINIRIISCVTENETNKMYGVVHVNTAEKFTCVTLMSENEAQSNQLMNRGHFTSPMGKSINGEPGRGPDETSKFNETNYIIQVKTKADNRAIWNGINTDIHVEKIQKKLKHNAESKNINNFTMNFAGFRNEKIEIGGRIVGGRDASPGEVPYLVSLSLFGQLYCGGTLLSLRWFVSARHCFTDEDLKWNRYNPLIVAGSIYRDYKQQKRQPQLQEIVKIYWHDEGDIALVMLKQPFRNTSFVQFIDYYKMEDSDFIDDLLSEDNSLKKYGTVSGFGATMSKDRYGNQLSQGVAHPPVLHIVDLPLLSRWQCLGFLNDPAENEDSVVCTLGTYQDACHGDSGGPLVYGRKLLGVTSWGIGCATQYPGIYVRVSYYQNWIQAVMESGGGNRDFYAPSVYTDGFGNGRTLGPEIVLLGVNIALVILYHTWGRL